MVGRPDHHLTRAVHHVFVYGTLKGGHVNAPLLPVHTLLGRGTTVDAYPLVTAGPWHSPVLIDEPGSELRVAGEIITVDDAGLARIDELESVGREGGYVRRRVAVVGSEGTATQCWAYVKQRAALDEIHSQPVAEYGPDPRYVPRQRR